MNSANPRRLTARFALTVAFGCVLATKGVAADSGPYASLHTEWKAATDRAKSEVDDQVSLRARKLDIARTYTPRFLKMAEAHKGDEEIWFSCVTWIVVEGAVGESFDQTMRFVRDQLSQLRHSVGLQLLLTELISKPSNSADELLNHLADTHPSSALQGVALYVLGVRTKNRAEQAGSLELAREAERLLERVVENAALADARSRHGRNGDNARRELAELRGPRSLGKVAPEIRGTDLDGQTFKLSDYRGRVVVLSFSGHWCVPCRQMHPYEQTLVQRHSRDDFALIEINSDKDKHALQESRESKNLTWRCIFDGGGTRGPISRAWEVDAWPVFYVLDRSGAIRFVASGAPREKLAQWVDMLLRE